MATRRFEFEEGGSRKFWEVTLDGASFTVRYGRIGAAGSTKTTTTGSDAEAAKEVDKLIREKTKKGYQEVGEGVAKNWRPPTHFSSSSHVDKLRSRAATAFDPDAEPGDEDEAGRKRLPTLRECDRRAFVLDISYEDDDETFTRRLDALLAEPRLGELKSLIIGRWFAEYHEREPTEIWQKLIDAAPRFTALEDLFIAEIIQEECEISWLHTGNIGPLLSAFPALRHAWVRGHGEELRFAGLSSATLEHLTVQSGGLSQQAVTDLTAASLPNLRELVLWLGTSWYGNDIDVGTLGPLLSRFPRLEHLGLQDAHNQDEVIAEALRSPVIGQLRGLDFSMGTTSDVGARAILADPRIASLKHLNLRWHYISDAALLHALRALPIEVDVSDRQQADDDDRYPEVTE